MSVAAIEQCLAQWANAFSLEDPAEICALYDVDANLWGTLSSIRRNSQPLIRQYFDQLFGFEQRRVELLEQQVRVFGQVAVCSGIYRFHWRDEYGTVDTEARYSFVFAQRDEKWLIVEHHSSVHPSVA